MNAKEMDNTLLKTYRKGIFAKFMKAIREYELIQEGDVIGICISGGKDSMVMAKCFALLARFSKVTFRVEYIVMDPGYSPVNRQRIVDNAKQLDIPIRIFDSNIFASVEHIEKNPCYLCARMRRGYLYRYAKDLGCNKIALGHHYDDVIETNLMNLFYAGEVRTMMPKLHATNFEDMQLIRPLYLVREADILLWKDYIGMEFLQCACRFTEDIEKADHEHSSKRKEVKALIQQLNQSNPFIESNIFHSMSNVNLDKVLAYYDDEHEVSFLDTYDK
ncbi:tRNA 2-thiocytidine biosynthesis protein TtcA [Erysipelotrichaceae bacterium MTC7]|nr:tRNA 2-thiocytidine biosynthesis protein TtcA [Erysipelotrichaceae bacterium MTC7]